MQMFLDQSMRMMQWHGCLIADTKIQSDGPSVVRWCVCYYYLLERYERIGGSATELLAQVIDHVDDIRQSAWTFFYFGGQED